MKRYISLNSCSHNDFMLMLDRCRNSCDVVLALTLEEERLSLVSSKEPNQHLHNVIGWWLSTAGASISLVIDSPERCIRVKISQSKSRCPRHLYSNSAPYVYIGENTVFSQRLWSYFYERNTSSCRYRAVRARRLLTRSYWSPLMRASELRIDHWIDRFCVCSLFYCDFISFGGSLLDSAPRSWYSRHQVKFSLWTLLVYFKTLRTTKI